MPLGRRATRLERGGQNRRERWVFSRAPPTTTTTRNLDGTDLHTPSPRLESLSWSEAGK